MNNTKQKPRRIHGGIFALVRVTTHNARKSPILRAFCFLSVQPVCNVDFLKTSQKIAKCAMSGVMLLKTLINKAFAKDKNIIVVLYIKFCICSILDRGI